jgi:hypothetical protein
MNHASVVPARNVVTQPPSVQLLPVRAPVDAHAAPANNAPAAALAAPVCHPGGCAEEGHKIDWKCFFDWLCYKPLKGGCPKKGCCGCNCSIPLYTYFLGECKEGRHYELPPCAADCDRPGVFRQMLRDARGRMRSSGDSCSSCGSCGSCGNCCSKCFGPCGGSGHRYFARPTGH